MILLQHDICSEISFAITYLCLKYAINDDNEVQKIENDTFQHNIYLNGVHVYTFVFIRGVKQEIK
jgi:hypothetical protein